MCTIRLILDQVSSIKANITAGVVHSIITSFYVATIHTPIIVVLCSI